MKQLKTKELFYSKEEIIAHQLVEILAPNDLKISETEYKVLAYVFLYGRDAILKASRAKLGSHKSIENILTRFRKEGIIHGIRNKTKLHPSIKPFVDSIEYKIKINLIDE